MSKISNCLFMLEYLENGWKYNIKELAEKLEVSERMIRSYKEELEKSKENNENSVISLNYVCKDPEKKFYIFSSNINTMCNIIKLLFG